MEVLVVVTDVLVVTDVVVVSVLVVVVVAVVTVVVVLLVVVVVAVAFAFGLLVMRVVTMGCLDLPSQTMISDATVR